MDNKLSIVVLVYNTQKYLRECIDSIINQSYKNIEVILVNDGSKDESGRICDEYAEQHEYVSVIHQKNQGGAVAGNNGIGAATGKYLALVDSDDIVASDGYEKLIRAIEGSNADLAIGKPKIIKDGRVRDVLHEKEQLVWESEREVQALLDFEDIFYDVFYWNKVYLTQFIKNNKCFMPDGMLYADGAMMVQVYAAANKIKIIEDVVYYWRKRDTSDAASISSQGDDIRLLEDRFESLNFQFDFLNQKSPKIAQAWMRRHIDRIFFHIKHIVENLAFREYFLSESNKFLSKLDDIYNLNIPILHKVYTYCLIKQMYPELFFCMAKGPHGPVVKEGSSVYWALPLFDSNDQIVPKELFKIRRINADLINFSGITFKNNELILNGIIERISDFPYKSASLVFRSCSTASVQKIPLELISNTFQVSLAVNEFLKVETYEVFMDISHEYGMDTLRLNKKMFKSGVKQLISSADGNNFEVFFSQNKQAMSIRVWKQVSRNRLPMQWFRALAHKYI